MTNKIVIASGKRKQAVARANIRKGDGKVSINGTPLAEYLPLMFRQKIQEPILIAGDLSNSVDIDVNIRGGGQSGQTEAARLAIARGLVDFSGSKELKQAYLGYDRHLLVADVRRNEPHKPNKSSPRSKRQKSYR
jgi:small subunit ribosomal protein S9